MVLEHPGSLSRAATSASLYFSAEKPKEMQETPTTVRLIPYYAWANREPAAMQVWIPYVQV